MTQEQPKNIYQRINAVMQEEQLYIRRGSAGQGTGVLYDEVISILAPLLVKHGIVSYTEKAQAIESRTTAKGHYVYQCDFNVHYVNIDNPEDRIVVPVESHAQDAGDKAPGKAITYASKIAHLKVFGIETGENDESRADMRNPDLITQEDLELLTPYIIQQTEQGVAWTPQGQKLAQVYKFAGPDQIRAKDVKKIKKDLGL